MSTAPAAAGEPGSPPPCPSTAVLGRERRPAAGAGLGGSGAASPGSGAAGPAPGRAPPGGSRAPGAPWCAEGRRAPGEAPPQRCPARGPGAAAGKATCRAAPGKGKPLKAGRLCCNSARHDRPPAGHLGIPATLCLASGLAPKENSITLLYRVLAGHHPTLT